MTKVTNCWVINHGLIFLFVCFGVDFIKDNMVMLIDGVKELLMCHLLMDHFSVSY